MAVASSEGLGHTAKPCRHCKTEVEDGKDFYETEDGSFMCRRVSIGNKQKRKPQVKSSLRAFNWRSRRETPLSEHKLMARLNFFVPVAKSVPKKCDPRM